MRLVTDVIERLSEESELHRSDVSEAIRAKMTVILDDLVKSANFLGATVSSVDGLAWAERIAEGFDQHRFSAMSSSLLAISDELAREVGCGPTKNLLIEGEKGKILVMHAGPLLLLTVFTKHDATLGMALAQAAQAANDLASIQV